MKKRIHLKEDRYGMYYLFAEYVTAGEAEKVFEEIKVNMRHFPHLDRFSLFYHKSLTKERGLICNSCNFFSVGDQKNGSSSLFQLLDQVGYIIQSQNVNPEVRLIPTKPSVRTAPMGTVPNLNPATR